jgi:hypothetical protein
MARPADAVDQVAEKLREYWTGLVKHEEEFVKVADKKLCELVRQCVDELWEEHVENTWQTQWKDVVVWKRVAETKPGEAERRIRENVRQWLTDARQLKYTRYSFTEGIHRVGAYVDRWFGGETQGGATAGVRKETKQTDAQRSAENMRNLLAELRSLMDKYARNV